MDFSMSERKPFYPDFPRRLDNEERDDDGDEAFQPGGNEDVLQYGARNDADFDEAVTARFLAVGHD